MPPLNLSKQNQTAKGKINEDKAELHITIKNTTVTK